MEQVLQSLGTQIYSKEKHQGFQVPWKLIGPLCRKWSRNRDPDMSRVQEMLAYYQRGGYIPCLIHLAEIRGEGLVCYDGNHRREVFNQCDDDIVCIVDVMFDACQNDVYKAFDHINKSVQLPAIYLDNDDNDTTIKEEIIQLVRSYEAKYKAFQSTSTRYHAPNFNRDAFVENVYHMYQNFNGKMDIQGIAQLLEKLNIEYSKERLCRPHSTYKPHVVEKCKKHNMWLFLERTIPFEHIHRVLHEY